MPSPSTLIRRARKTRNPKEAKRLRKLAASARRALRAKASSKAPKAKPAKKAAYDPRATSAAALNVDGAGWMREGATLGEQAEAAPPIITGMAIESLRHLAKKKYQPGRDPADPTQAAQVDDFAIALRAKLVSVKRDAEADAHSKAEENHIRLLKTVHEVNAINVVCAFMATMQAYEKMHNGLPPTAIISGHTLARVYDALRDAGYTAEGKGGAGGRAGDRDALRRQIAGSVRH